MTALDFAPPAPAGGTVEQHIAASLARRLGNAIVARDLATAEHYDDQLIDAVDAARTHGVPLAAVVAALQAEADLRGWR